LKAERLNEYRRLAEAHPGHRSAKIILELIAEIERLTTKGRFKPDKPLGDDSSCPLGKYKGEKMSEVPPDYLLWYWDEIVWNEDAIALDITYYKSWPQKIVAMHKLRMHDYIRYKFKELLAAKPGWVVKHQP